MSIYRYSVPGPETYWLWRPENASAATTVKSVKKSSVKTLNLKKILKITGIYLNDETWIQGCNLSASNAFSTTSVARRHPDKLEKQIVLGKSTEKDHAIDRLPTRWADQIKSLTSCRCLMPWGLPRTGVVYLFMIDMSFSNAMKMKKKHTLLFFFV